MKKLLSVLLTVCMCLSVGIMLTACGKEHTNTHPHDLTKVEAVAATCETAGNSEYYTCDCGKYFSDAYGITEIAKDSWVIPAGHSFSNVWTYNETHHWKEATCEHTTEKGEYAEHSIVDGKCSICDYVANLAIEVAGKTFNFVCTDVTLSTITYNSGNVVFKADGSIEIYLVQTIHDGDTVFPNASTAVGTYVQNGNNIVFTLIGVRIGEEFMEYPEEIIAEHYKDLTGVIEGNTVILSAPYMISETESGVQHLTFELAQ